MSFTLDNKCRMQALQGTKNVVVFITINSLPGCPHIISLE